MSHEATPERLHRGGEVRRVAQTRPKKESKGLSSGPLHYSGCWNCQTTAKERAEQMGFGGQLLSDAWSGATNLARQGSALITSGVQQIYAGATTAAKWTNDAIEDPGAAIRQVASGISDVQREVTSIGSELYQKATSKLKTTAHHLGAGVKVVHCKFRTVRKVIKDVVTKELQTHDTVVVPYVGKVSGLKGKAIRSILSPLPLGQAMNAADDTGSTLYGGVGASANAVVGVVGEEGVFVAPGGRVGVYRTAGGVLSHKPGIGVHATAGIVRGTEQDLAGIFDSPSISGGAFGRAGGGLLFNEYGHLRGASAQMSLNAEVPEPVSLSNAVTATEVTYFSDDGNLTTYDGRPIEGLMHLGSAMWRGVRTIGEWITSSE